jgi:hypothetical protein
MARRQTKGGQMTITVQIGRWGPITLEGAAGEIAEMLVWLRAEADRSERGEPPPVIEVPFPRAAK